MRGMISCRLFLLIILNLAITNTSAHASFLEYPPDIYTVVLDHFNGFSTANYVNGALQYSDGLPGLQQAADFSLGKWARYNLPAWDATVGTVEMWIRPQSYHSNITLHWNNTSSPPGAGYVFHFGTTPEGKLRGSIWNGGDGYIVGTTTVPLDEWVHIAYTWGPDGTRLWLNNQVDAYKAENLYPASPQYAYLNYWGAEDTGDIDEFRISRIQRTFYDLEVPLSQILNLSPDTGGNAGTVTVNVFGTGFLVGDTIKLTVSGQPDIIGSNVAVRPSGTVLTASFDLTGVAPGPYSVVITQPDGTMRTVPKPFIIEQGGAADVWVDIVGWSKLRGGKPQTYYILYGNRGNVDTGYVTVWLNFPNFISWDPAQSQKPDAMGTIDTENTILAFNIPVISAGSAGVIPISLTGPADPQYAHREFQIQAWYDAPDDIPTADSQSFSEISDLSASIMASSLLESSDSCPSPAPTAACGKTVEECKSDIDASHLDSELQIMERDRRTKLEAAGFCFTNCPCKIGTEKKGCTEVARLTEATFQSLLKLKSSLGLGNDCRLVITGGSETDSHNKSLKKPPHGHWDGYKVDIHPDACVSKAICDKCTQICSRCRGEIPIVEPQWQCANDDVIIARESTHWDISFDEQSPPSNCCPPSCAASNSTCPPGEIITPDDPNDKAGSQGVGPQQYISGETPLRYAIQFENKPTASAAAQTVVVTDQLDIANEDLSTFTLGPISVANQLVTPPPGPGAGDFSTTLDLRPDNNLLLAINTHLDATTGLLTWTFQSLDPATNQPPEDPEAGFLPPGAGGSMFFTVMPKEGLATNTEIRNFASIVFDANAPMDTPTWLNTIDNTPPESHVLPLPANENSPGFTVQWGGSDAGAGVRDYNIFVSQDGGDFTPFLTETTATSAVFTGQPGHSYAFYSLSRDLTGNREVKSPVSEAGTLVQADSIPPATTAALSPAPNASGWNNSDVAVQLNSVDNEGGSGVSQITYSAAGAQSIPVTTVNGDSTSFTIANEGVSAVKFYAMDNAANLEAEKSQTIKLDKTFPEAYNQFDPVSQDVILFGRDALSGVVPGPIAPASVVFLEERDDDDDDRDSPDEDDVKLELRTYRILDLAGNPLVLVEKVKKSAHHLTVNIVSLQYGQGPVINLSRNRQSFEWVLERDEGLKKLKQKFVVGPQRVKAEFDSRTNQTIIRQGELSSKNKVVRPGLAFLRMVTAGAKLFVEF